MLLSGQGPEGLWYLANFPESGWNCCPAPVLYQSAEAEILFCSEVGGEIGRSNQAPQFEGGAMALFDTDVQWLITAPHLFTVPDSLIQQPMANPGPNSEFGWYGSEIWMDLEIQKESLCRTARSWKYSEVL